MPKTIILIPSRMSATRLPGKPLLKINNLSIISHVVRKALETKIGEVVVATEDQEILYEVEKNGGKAILTSNLHKTGTDRIFECFKKLKLLETEYIINLQGDEPQINKDDIIKLNNLMIKNNSNIGTLAAKIYDESMLPNENIVKVNLKEKLDDNNFPLAFDFKRKITDEKNLYTYHHIGIYCYKVETLEKFIQLKQSKNEIKSRLEQLRALDNNLNINVALAKSSPIGIDTKEDYLAIKKIMEYKS
ncbi:3-deoxy-manno-octulosonate cytidylyltransferase [Candidatus Pelagibacter sp.]|nr:3-deoxy-manno-octulosonate cytidylyltransferase [Candidatus Pelagibacter sp.]|tara:strand:- start:927 stop:1667 length:741 start_codon:yes stop_codon:yes gene_type:complete